MYVTRVLTSVPREKSKPTFSRRSQFHVSLQFLAFTGGNVTVTLTIAEPVPNEGVNVKVWKVGLYDALQRMSGGAVTVNVPLSDAPAQAARAVMRRPLHDRSTERSRHFLRTQ